ncbi:MAG: hypothetical protein QF691_12225 [SAR324 cluster bacterium]|nr:hypothetical protein [SAR324 cluster bacterium]
MPSVSRIWNARSYHLLEDSLLGGVLEVGTGVGRVRRFLRRNATHPKGIIHRMSDYAVLIRPTGGCCLGHQV